MCAFVAQERPSNGFDFDSCILWIAYSRPLLQCITMHFPVDFFFLFWMITVSVALLLATFDVAFLHGKQSLWSRRRIVSFSHTYTSLHHRKRTVHSWDTSDAEMAALNKWIINICGHRIPAEKLNSIENIWELKLTIKCTYDYRHTESYKEFKWVAYRCSREL